ncbi:putative bifunctional diguanylate cyclase/phosphodiesterase [Novosphingobium sp. MBES04]|uniref:putative bifunctional diguanylate cyclase/phosphodiesterase n=1 Tax=Novosphingobium sp. MBES04 TaxID=1206458 RepID=UPI00072360F6|nr:EAL domain-containing protein [Novosphingobium sp. MBES04]GAM05073.1 diguanylate cyclase [Novosphingobium sp. MBES04]
MKERRAHPPGGGSDRRGSAFALSLALAIMVLGTLLVALLQWSGSQVDRIARERDQATAKTVVAQSVEQMSHGLEVGASSRALLGQLSGGEPDLEWLDVFAERWFTDYAGLAETYLLSPEGAPLYAIRGNARVAAHSYIGIEQYAAPLAEQMRAATIRNRTQNDGSSTRTPVVADLRFLRGRPAILSVKPVLAGQASDGERVGAVPMVVGVAYLDGSFFERLAQHYGLADMRYQSGPRTGPGETSAPLRDRSSQVMGYLVWRAFAPGQQVVSALGPVSMLLVLVVASVVFFLASRLTRRTRDLAESRSEAHYQALHDPLTGLANRMMFEAWLDEALERCEQGPDGAGHLALLCIDLDRFKLINDTLGHPAGDELIRQVAARLRAEVRDYDMVARMAGDEFAIAICEPEDRAAVEGICARIIEQLARPFDLFGARAYIGGSIGVALAPDDSRERTELTRRVDIALTTAKAEGRGRYLFFTPAMDANIRAREELVQALRHAVHEDPAQLHVHYQPMYCARTGAIRAVEALLRWEHPERGFIGPGTFIPQAEESGLIEALGNFVLRRALEDARAWPDVRVSVNISPSQMRCTDFVTRVRDLLEESGVAPQRLELEMTETALMASSRDVRRTIAALRELEVACALDDFGTGYSSLSHIRDMAVDRIKVDKSFVAAISTPQGAGLVEAIVSVARVHGMAVTAEGVETPMQLAFLRDLGCHELQGFLLSHPVCAENLSALLAESRAGQGPALQWAGSDGWAI